MENTSASNTNWKEIGISRNCPGCRLHCL